MSLLWIWLSSGFWAAPTPPERVLVQPWTSSAISDTDRRRVDTRIRAAVTEQGRALASTAVGVAAAQCESKACLNRTLAQHGVAYWLRPTLDGEDRVYTLTLTLWSLESAMPVARVRERCVVCGHAELADLAAASAGRLSGWMNTDTDGLPRLAISVTPADAKISIDGTTMPPGFVRGPLSPGEHIVEVAAPGHRTELHQVDVQRGDTAELSITLARVGDTRGWKLATAGVVVGGGAVAVGTGLLIVDGRPVGRRCGRGHPDNVDGQGDCRYVYRTKLAGGVAVGLGAIAAGASLMTLVLRHPARQRASARLGVGPRGVVVRGRF